MDAILNEEKKSKKDKKPNKDLQTTTQKTKGR